MMKEALEFLAAIVAVLALGGVALIGLAISAFFAIGFTFGPLWLALFLWSLP